MSIRILKLQNEHGGFFYEVAEDREHRGFYETRGRAETKARQLAVVTKAETYEFAEAGEITVYRYQERRFGGISEGGWFEAGEIVEEESSLFMEELSRLC